MSKIQYSTLPPDPNVVLDTSEKSEQIQNTTTESKDFKKGEPKDSTTSQYVFIVVAVLILIILWFFSSTDESKGLDPKKELNSTKDMLQNRSLSQYK